jgi:hypothetical protein
MQVFVEDEKLRKFFKCVPELKRAKIFAADPLESRFHLLKNQRYTNRTEVLLEPDALYIRPVRAHPHISSPHRRQRRKPGRFASDLTSPPLSLSLLYSPPSGSGSRETGEATPHSTRPGPATPTGSGYPALLPSLYTHDVARGQCAEC